MHIPVYKRVFSGIILLVFLTIPALSQPPVKNYEKEWKKVDDLVNKKLPRSALVEVRKIYALAKKEKQDVQVIKSLVYISGLQQETREDNEKATIKEMEPEINSLPQPARSIAYSLLADLYWSYFEKIRFNLYGRTKTEKFVKEDPDTWDTEDFHRVISSLYLVSIKEEKLLQQTRLENYNSIIATYGYRYLRPTLYDFLAHRALDYFTNDERDLVKPAYRFTINQEEAFAPYDEFSKTRFVTKDTSSLFYKAFLLFQQLLKFHQGDARKDALVDLDIRRIEFVYQYGTMKEKEKLYEKALTGIKNRFPDDSSAAYASYLIASVYFSKGWYIDPNSGTKDSTALIKAKAICDEVINKFPASFAAKQCTGLLSSIKEKSFSNRVELVNLPGKPFRFLFVYRNLDKIYLRLIKTNHEEIKKFSEDNNTDDWWKKRVDLTPIREWTQDLPDPKDYLSHSAELKVDALPAGSYILLLSEKPGFPVNENILSSHVIHISNISYVGHGAEYFVLDRDSGKPLADATIQAWQSKYDYKTSKYIEQKAGLFKTDKNGSFKLVKNADNGNFSFEITHGNDYLFLNDQIYETYDSRNTTTEKSPLIKMGYLFTDRSIYRPGQLLYFKGLAIQFDPNTQKHNILPRFQTKVILRDANYQKAGEMIVTTNESGTYHGSFRLPEGKMNGNFTLTDSLNNAYESISVEEYKRPKFSVEVKKPTGIYRLNDSVTVKGVAKAYTGNMIDGAKVKYRITRYRHISWWHDGYRGFPYNRDQMAIESGEAITDSAGEFIITFLATGDEDSDEEGQAIFDFEVNADVTDINGETRSDKTTVIVSNRSIQLKADIPERSDIDSLKKLNISSFNSNDLFESALVKINIYSLKSPARLFRSRLWQSPDQFIMTREESYTLFPHDLYNDEDDMDKWERSKILEDTFTTREETLFAIKKASAYTFRPGTVFQPGWYLIEVTANDKYGKPVTEKKYIRLFNSATSHVTHFAGVKVDKLKPAGEPGEKLRYRLNTSLPDIWIIQNIISRRKEKERKIEVLNAESRLYEIDVTEEDRGGRTLSWMFVKNNRLYSGAELFTVPWTNKELKISYETFRDKVLPGSEEKWKIKINDAKGDKTAAEVLVSMYDASLDQFKYHSWSKPNIYSQSNDAYNGWRGHNSFIVVDQNGSNRHKKDEITEYQKIYDHFSFVNDRQFGILPISDWYYGYRDISNPRLMKIPSPLKNGDDMAALTFSITPGLGLTGNLRGVQREGTWKNNGYFFNANEDGVAEKFDEGKPGGPVQIRKNLNETAFFFPELRTDSAGAIEFSFTMPEALTKWKFQTFAHTKELAFGYSSRETITQKQLMVLPNPPRFVREGDQMEFSAKIVNLTDKEITGQAQFQLFDAATNESVDGRFKNIIPNQYFTVAAGQSEAIKFPVEVPYQFNAALVWRVVARAPLSINGEGRGEVSDGEENALPVLTNRMLVTESMPLNMRGTGTKNFKMEKLINSGNSETLQHHSLVVEYTSNPVWYAVQALPYLMEYPYECAEQIWNRYYANSLATMIANSSPRIKQLFEQWIVQDTAALLSNLQKNAELKAILLEETPWVLQAKTEAEQKKNMALLFDMVKMSTQLNSAFATLKDMQSSNGGFVWFRGGPDDRYITQYIITGIGHLKKLRAIAGGQDSKLKEILNLAIPYLDKKIKEDYAGLIKYKTDLKKYIPGSFIIQYLYMRSFFPEYKIAPASQAAYIYFRGRAQKTWKQQTKYMQGMLALALARTSDAATPAAILKSLKETSVNNEELGRYWKDASRGWFWHEAPIERQSLLIEAFQEIAKDSKTADELRTWLLKNKQTNNWESTKATAEACYALLLQGTQWMNNEPAVQVQLGNLRLTSSKDGGTEPAQAGTGYFKKTIEGNKVNPQMGDITVSLTPYPSPNGEGNAAPSWGGVYWQYFEDLDKITAASTPLKLVKKLFVEKNTDRGIVLTPVNDGEMLKVGDKIKVRIELRVDREMEYVHMKDMRASAMEPVNVLSSYKWQGGLGYYESTKDASTNFFFNNLRRGTYVFEYPLFITHAGNFSNGITTIQCMYAPEFSSHSEGIRVNVE